MHQFFKDFALDIVRQLFGWGSPRSGHLILTRHAFNKMHEYQLNTLTLYDAFRHGDEVKDNMIIRQYMDYSVGLTFKPGSRVNQFVIITCWKRENW
jgi:hypothetical protein